MRHAHRWVVTAFLVLAGLLSAACAKVAPQEEALTDPATVEEVEGSDAPRVTLTQEASERLDIQASSVTKSGTGTTIPYAAVFYTASGDTWTYTTPEPLTFVRVPIVVERISGDRAYLSQGPPAGTEVVTQGAVELYGTETGVEE